MDFNLTEEHLMIQQAARDFAQAELLPGVIERDEHAKFPEEQVKKMAELGFLGMMVDPKYGGSGLDSVSYVIAMTEIAKVDASAAVVMSVNNSLVCAGMEKYCSEEQKQKYLVPLAKGDVIGAFCLSEPEAGSDATSQKTTAIDKGDHYLLNGTKTGSRTAQRRRHTWLSHKPTSKKVIKASTHSLLKKDGQDLISGQKRKKWESVVLIRIR
jgi:alkylation response protein AidB-like acyl-CoA dehydrogenase